MQSIRGIYNGTMVVPLEQTHAKPNSKVIITFLDEPVERPRPESDRGFLALFGTWEDSRSADEIVQDIYETRTQPGRDVDL
ncbi:MAG: hypothetical protein NTW86_24955 [Candidatus Sumerlaeota bacterium]|nr:hypothetical protein [Candidatus Sumerlaeota bacterium]